MKKTEGLMRFAFLTGFVIDLLAVFPLLFPPVARAMFGLGAAPPGGDYLYVSRLGASLMAGWAVLLLWGSFRPMERKGLLLLTLFPVVAGLAGASVAAALSGFIRWPYLLPLWIVYALLIPLYMAAYFAGRRK